MCQSRGIRIAYYYIEDDREMMRALENDFDESLIDDGLLKPKEGEAMENLSGFIKKGSTRRVSASRKVLIVEDDLFLAAIVGRAVYDINPDCDIDWTTNLEQSLGKVIQRVDQLGRSPYDLVIADIMLDGRGTGLDLWKVFCRTYPQVPVILISSLTRKEIFKMMQPPNRFTLSII